MAKDKKTRYQKEMKTVLDMQRIVCKHCFEIYHIKFDFSEKMLRGKKYWSYHALLPDVYLKVFAEYPFFDELVCLVQVYMCRIRNRITPFTS